MQLQVLRTVTLLQYSDPFPFFHCWRSLVMVALVRKFAKIDIWISVEQEDHDSCASETIDLLKLNRCSWISVFTCFACCTADWILNLHECHDVVLSCTKHIETFPLSLRVSEILPLLFSSTPLFPYPTSPLVSLKFPHVPLGIGGSLFWLQRAKALG